MHLLIWYTVVTILREANMSDQKPSDPRIGEARFTVCRALQEMVLAGRHNRISDEDLRRFHEQVEKSFAAFGSDVGAGRYRQYLREIEAKASQFCELNKQL